MINLFGEETNPPANMTPEEDKAKWETKFKEYLNREYEDKADTTGRFCCGYDWLCEYCKQEKMNGCDDCFDTIIELLKDNDVEIDYYDYDFENWERKAKGEEYYENV